MSDPQDLARGFLRRWSQRKRAAEMHTPDRAAPTDHEFKPVDANVSAQVSTRGEAALPQSDPSALPPVDSITATSDIHPFLAAGVPEDIKRAALRRVWVTDPAIRDFVGMAENQWDFTKPDSVPGFGSLELTPELRRMVAELIGDGPGGALPRPDDEVGRVGQIVEKPGELASSPTVLPSVESGTLARNPAADAGASPALAQAPSQDGTDVALHKDLVDPDRHSARRKHGGAVPK